MLFGFSVFYFLQFYSNLSGADLNCTSKSGWTPLALACTRGYSWDLPKLLLQESMKRAQDRNLQEPGSEPDSGIPYEVFLWAVEGNQVELLADFLEWGAVAGNLNKSKQSAFHVAAKAVRRDCGTCFCFLGWTWSKLGGSGMVFAKRAMFECGQLFQRVTHLECQFPFLLSTNLSFQGAIEAMHQLAKIPAMQHVDIDASDIHGLSALDLSARRDDVAMITALVQQGCVTGERTGAKSTPMHYAAMYGSEAALTYLVELGQDDVNLVDSQGWTALDYSDYYRHTECAAYLLKNGGTFS